MNYLEFPFWCYLRQLFVSLSFRKCKKDCSILKGVLVQGFCPLTTENVQFSMGFRLKDREDGLLVKTKYLVVADELRA